MLRWTKSVEYKSLIGLLTLWSTKSSSKIKLTLPFTQTWPNTEFRCLVTESGTGFLGRRAEMATSTFGNTRVTSATSSLKSVSRSWAEYSLCTSLPSACRIIRLTSSRTAQAVREAVTSGTLAPGMVQTWVLPVRSSLFLSMVRRLESPMTKLWMVPLLGIWILNLADAATGVEDLYSREQIQTVIKPRFYHRLC